MALTRKFLSALGIEAEKQDEIINAHTEVTDGLKDKLAKAEADAAKLPEVQAELDSLKEAAAKNDGKNPFEVKYNALKEEFEDYKAGVAKKDATAKKEAAYRALLKEAQVNEKRHDVILKCDSDKIDAIELDKDGNIKGKDKLIESVKAEWADFITTTTTTGAQTPNPPANNGSVLKTKEDIYKKDEHGRYVLDASERQKAWSEVLAAQQQKG